MGIRQKSRIFGVVGIAAIWLCSPAYALDDLIEGAKLCTRQLPHYEREYGIPTHLLSAIASTESGRYHEGLGLKVPWPWTINVEGKGYFFASKQEAMAAVHKFQARGIQSIDVGCMQVNLFHHPNAFRSLDEAFEPQTNIGYAASFLRSLYEEEKSWKKAAADYHSKTPSLGTEYAGIVYDSWYQILEKLRLAHLQVAEPTEMAANEAPAPYVRRMDAPIVQEFHSVKPLPEQEGKKLPVFHTAHSNVIQLSKKDTSHENGVIVVRPDISMSSTAQAPTAPLTVAQAKPVEETPMVATEPHIINVNATLPPQSTDGRKTGPTFIFND